MKLKDAIFEMNPHDKFEWLGRDYVYMDKDKVMREKSGSLLRMSPGNLNVTGEIIPAKKEPVNFDEFWCNMKEANVFTATSYDNARGLWKVSARNERLVFESLIDAVKDYLETFSVDKRSGVNLRFEQALEKIKKHINLSP